MKRYLYGLIATIGILFLVAVPIICVACLMECIAVGNAWPATTLIGAVACGIVGYVIMKELDKVCSNTKEDK